jgi:uncharacterized membrane protein YqjE
MNDRPRFNDDVRTGVATAPEVYPTDGHTTTRSTLLTTADGEPSLGELVMGLTDDVTTLVRKEVELAKAELQESAKASGKAAGMIGAGGMVAYAGLLLILAAIAIALGDWWNNYWLSTAVVGLATGLIGWAILNGGMKQFKEINLVPRKTIDSLERDAQMAKEKLS